MFVAVSKVTFMFFIIAAYNLHSYKESETCGACLRYNIPPCTPGDANAYIDSAIVIRVHSVDIKLQHK